MKTLLNRIICYALMFPGLAINLSVLAAQDDNDVQLQAPQAPTGLVIPPLGEGPFVYDTAEGLTIEVEVLARGLDHPWSIAFLPDGRFLVTEKNSGQLRVIDASGSVSDPVNGVPEVSSGLLNGLLDVTLHPDFQQTRYVYLSYNKLLGEQPVVAVARGRWDGQSLQDTRDIFVSRPGTSGGARLLFGPDDMLYVSLFGSETDVAQDMMKHSGKILRLTPDGEIPANNPYTGTDNVLPEIFSIGHRSVSGMTAHPDTGELFSIEMGPNGGDELNLVNAGANYGWPVVSLGRTYMGEQQGQSFSMQGMEDPVIYWMPSISVSGITIYSGDAMPEWQGNIFIGGLRAGQIPGTGQLQRIMVNDQMQELRRESLLTDLRQRIRDVKQGPDGLLYVLTDEDDGAVLRISPH